MKILIVKTFPDEINTTTYNSQEVGEAVALRRLGHECDILSISADGEYHEDDMTIGGETFKFYKVKGVKFLLNGWLKGCDYIFEQYDMLSVSEYHQIYTWRLAKKYAKKMIVYHGPYYSPYKKKYNLMASVFDIFFLNRYKKLGTTFITKSGLAAEYLKSKGLKKVYPVGVGISDSLLSVDGGEQLDFCKRINNESGFKLLYVGVIEDRRNSLFLLDVLTGLIKDKIDAKLVIVGKYRNEAYKQLFEKKVSENKLEDRIIYQKVVKQGDLAQVYRAVDAFLFPTRYDIYGMVLLESMFYGLPTISTLCGGSEMMIKDGINGVLINEYDADKWVAAVESLIHDANKRKTMGQKATETIKNCFTWDALANKFLSVFDEKIKE